MNIEADKLAEALRKIDRLCAAETDMPFTQIAAIRAANKEACAILAAYDPVWSAVHRGMEHALHSAPRMAVTDVHKFCMETHGLPFPLFKQAMIAFAASHSGDEQQARDAARYRWLRQPNNCILYARVPHEGWGQDNHAHIKYDSGAEYDSAIDAAIEQQKADQAKRDRQLASFDPLQDEPR